VERGISPEEVKNALFKGAKHLQEEKIARFAGISAGKDALLYHEGKKKMVLEII